MSATQVGHGNEVRVDGNEAGSLSRDEGVRVEMLKEEGVESMMLSQDWRCREEREGQRKDRREKEDEMRTRSA